MLNFTETPEVTGKAFTEHDYVRKYQDATASDEFKNVRRELAMRGTTFAQLMESGNGPAMTTSEAVQRTADWSGYLPDVFLSAIIEGTQYRGYSRKFCNVYNAPEGQPVLHYRRYDRFVAPQILGEDDEMKARKGTPAVDSIPFYTLGDRTGYTWASLKDLPIQQTAQDMRAIGAMISAYEDLFVANALYAATSGDNATEFENVGTAVITGAMGFAEFLRMKVIMSGPMSDSHPGLDDVTRRALLNLYNPNVLLVSPGVYLDLVTNMNLADQTFWRNGNNKILDDGSIETVFGLRIYRCNLGYWDTDWTWVEDDNVAYVIDTTMGGVDLVFKEPLQVVNWDTYENRRQNMMVYERLNSVVRQPRSVYRIDVSADTTGL